MNIIQMTKWCTITAVLAVATIGWNHPSFAQPDSPLAQEGIEVLTRGPVHEAFAETITFDPQPGIVISEAPPALIEEVAPDQRPDGENVTWIPGYWGWDDERSDFLWVSGIWRALPPGRQWVPGYWGEAQQGFQWTSGYWADAAASEIEYLPEPPATVEVGPNVAAPSADHIWLPGSWVWQQNRYGWRAGSWVQGHQDWDWVPDHYVWTPRGYVFVDGYYDYSVSRRGVVFAPVYFYGGLRNQRGFSYSPSTVINLSTFSRHLFLRPTYGHYYFGDYYGSKYASSGYTPWFSYQSSRRGYDPIYSRQRWQHRHDQGWEQQAEANYHNLRNNEGARPPHNWAAQAALAERAQRGNRGDYSVATSLEELVQRKQGRQRFIPVDPTEQQLYGQRNQDYRKYLQQRQQVEASQSRVPGGDPTATGPARRAFARSPYAAPPADQLGRGYAPPQRHEVLKPDFQVSPQPRTRGNAPQARSNSRQAIPEGATGQNNPQERPQRQNLNRGNRQGAPAAQSQGQGTARGNDRRGQDATSSQRQGAAQGKPEKKAKK